MRRPPPSWLLAGRRLPGAPGADQLLTAPPSCRRPTWWRPPVPARGAACADAATTQLGAPTGPRRFVTITSDRLEEFVRAELGFFAERQDRPLQPIALNDVLKASRTAGEMAKLLHEELPVRFARRVRHIERIAGWQAIPELLKLRAMHTTSFRELRLADPVTDAEGYQGVIARIRQRHKKIPPLFADALQRIDQLLLNSEETGSLGSSLSSCSIYEPGASDRELRMNRDSIDKWASHFLSSRVSTEILMSHYEAILGTNMPSAALANKIGIIDLHCDPFETCQQAIALVQSGEHPCVVEVESHCEKISFCQSPRYLFYIVVELLSNAARARPAAEQEHPIRVSVCANDMQVVIRISDRSGGMPHGLVETMWSFVSRVGAQRPPAAAAASPGPPSLLDDDAEAGAVLPGVPQSFVERPWAVFTGASPLSGRGIGLPLSRLYAKYLGGSLEVVNMPGLGVDAYLFLPRIEVDAGSFEADH